MRLMIIAALHGEETFGLKIVSNVLQACRPDIRVRIGNPEALAKGIRFIDKDLNRCFGLKDQSTTEARLAKSIEQEIKEYSPEFIIDLHTSFSDVDKVAIVDCYSDLTEHMAQELGMDTIIVSSKELIPGSLLSHFPENSMVLEFGRTNRSDKLAKIIADKILSINKKSIASLAKKDNKLPCYQLVSTISKDFHGLKDIKNLEHHPELDGYPFLAGIDTYEHIGGFLADRLR